jgi:hypothetical protein
MVGCPRPALDIDNTDGILSNFEIHFKFSFFFSSFLALIFSFFSLVQGRLVFAALVQLVFCATVGQCAPIIFRLLVEHDGRDECPDRFHMIDCLRHVGQSAPILFLYYSWWSLIFSSPDSGVGHLTVPPPHPTSRHKPNNVTKRLVIR